MEKLIDSVLIPIFVVLCAFAVYLLFVVAPVVFYTEAECLKSGYPKAYVTIGLERYCSNLDGVVTVKVEKISK